MGRRQYKATRASPEVIDYVKKIILLPGRKTTKYVINSISAQFPRLCQGGQWQRTYRPIIKKTIARYTKQELAAINDNYVTPLINLTPSNCEGQNDCITFSTWLQLNLQEGNIASLGYRLGMPLFRNEFYLHIKQCKHIYLREYPRNLELEAGFEEYEEEYKDILVLSEIKYEVNSNFMEKQPEDYYTILIEEMMRVQSELLMEPEVLYLAVHIVKKCLEKIVIHGDYWRLIAMIAIRIALNYICRNIFDLDHLSWRSNDVLDHDMILKVEREVMNIIEFDLGWPGPMSWLRLFPDISRPEILVLCQYFIDTTLAHREFCQWSTGRIVSAGMYMALYMYGDEWLQKHVSISGYSREALIPLVQAFFNICTTEKNSVVNAKYDDSGFPAFVHNMLLTL